MPWLYTFVFTRLTGSFGGLGMRANDSGSGRIGVVGLGDSGVRVLESRVRSPYLESPILQHSSIWRPRKAAGEHEIKGFSFDMVGVSMEPPCRRVCPGLSATVRKAKKPELGWALGSLRRLGPCGHLHPYASPARQAPPNQGEVRPNRASRLPWFQFLNWIRSLVAPSTYQYSGSGTLVLLR